MTDFIPPALFRPPDFPHPYVLRERLTSRFRQSRLARVVVVEASGGYGKSIGAAEFVHRLPDPFIWYPIEQLNHLTPLEFFWNFITATQTVWPEFGVRSAALFDSLSRLNPHMRGGDWLFGGLLPAIAAELNTLPRAVWLVLDNYHLLPPEFDFDRALAYLIEHTLPRVHWLIVSRATVNLPERADLFAERLLTAIDQPALAFSPRDALILSNKLGLRLPLGLFQSVAARLNGRPLSYRLLLQNLRGKSPVQIDRLLTLLADPAQPALDYLAQSSLQAETLSTRDFLFRTSLLKTLDPVTCDALLDSSNAAALLQRLSGSVFIHPSAGAHDAPPTFRHAHDNLREFLQNALLHEYGAEEVNRLHHRLGDIHEARDEFDQAIEHYCAGGDFQSAARLIDRQGRYLINTMQTYRIEPWLQSFPPEWIRRDPALTLYRGVLLANAGNPLALDSFHQALRLFEERGDLEGATRARVEMGWNQYVRTEYAEARAVLQTALANPALPTRLRARALHHLAMALHGADEFAAALQYALEAMQILRALDTHEDRAALARLLRHLGQIYHSVGRMQDALAVNREGHDLTIALDLGDWALAWMDFEWAENLLFAGQIEEGLSRIQFVQSLLEPYRALNVPSPLLDDALVTHAELLQERYDFAAAAALYRRVKHLEPRYWTLFQIAQPAHEVEALEAAQVDWRGARMHNSPVMRAKSQARMGVALLGVRDFAHAREHLEQAAAALQQRGAAQAALTARFYLSYALWKLHQTPAALTHLRPVLTTMERGGCLGLLIWRADYAAELCALALREGIEPHYVEYLAAQRLTAAQAAHFTALAAHPNEMIRARALRILAALGATATAQAREKLTACKNPDVEHALATWLASGWLTGGGLLRLEAILTWRQMHIFLLWLSPDMYGRTAGIAETAGVTVDTVNTHLKECRALLREALGVQFPAGKGAYMAAYDWAIREAILNPQAARSLISQNPI